MPGTSVSSFTKSRPFSGISAACAPSMVPPCTLRVVSTSGLTARPPRRLSCTPPARSSKSTRAARRRAYVHTLLSLCREPLKGRRDVILADRELRKEIVPVRIGLDGAAETRARAGHGNRGARNSGPGLVEHRPLNAASERLGRGRCCGQPETKDAGKRNPHDRSSRLADRAGCCGGRLMDGR